MNWLVGIFSAAKGYVVAFIVGIGAAVVAALAVYAKSQKGRAARFEAKYDTARQQAANARAGRDTYRAATEQAAKARDSIPQTPPDTESRNDLNNTF